MEIVFHPLKNKRIKKSDTAKPHAKGVLQYRLFLFFHLPLSGIKDVKMQCF